MTHAHPTQACGCTTHCGDDGDVDGPGTCKGLPIEKRPLVKVVLMHRDALARAGSPDSGLEADKQKQPAEHPAVQRRTR
jgi:hypothetical protein